MSDLFGMAASKPVFSSAAGGAAAGSMFGPVGAAIGGGIGAAMGMASSGEQRRMRKRATKQSYEMADLSFDYIATGREEANKAYEFDMASTRARFGASGAKLEGAAWDIAIGEHARIRDSRLAEFDKEYKAWEKSDAYALISEDYRHMTGVTEEFEKPNNRHKGNRIAKVRGHGRTGESLGRGFSTMVLDGGNIERKREIFAAYASRATPSYKEYEKYRFGSEEDKAAYESAMDERVAAADKWLAGRTAELRAQQRLQRIDDSRGAR